MTRLLWRREEDSEQVRAGGAAGDMHEVGKWHM